MGDCVLNAIYETLDFGLGFRKAVKVYLKCLEDPQPQPSLVRSEPLTSLEPRSNLGENGGRARWQVETLKLNATRQQRQSELSPQDRGVCFIGFNERKTCPRLIANSTSWNRGVVGQQEPSSIVA